MKSLKQLKQRGFTLIEMLAVVGIIGAVMLLAAPSLKNTTTGTTSKQIYDFVSRAAINWRQLNTSCGTSSDVATSAVVTPVSAANALSLIVSGTGTIAAPSTYLNSATYAGCAADANIQPMHTKVTGSVGAYKIAGYSVTWSGGGSSAITFVITSVPPEVALPLFKQYSSQVNASTATAFPTTADSTDPMIRFTAINAGTTDLSIIIN